MNETAAIARVWIGSQRLLFAGVLPDLLDWHRHSFHCVLLAPTDAFEVEDAHGAHRCRALLVRGGVAHRLHFTGQQMVTHYIAPHDPHFAALAAPGEQAVAPVPWHHGWSAALARWFDARDAGALRDVIHETWAPAQPAGLDRRVRRMAQRFAEGEGLADPPAALAADVGLSGSRLAHLVKAQTGSSIGEVQRGYKFSHAARSMVAAPTFTRAAHAAHFADSAHFSRAFRAAYGIAPSRILIRSTRWVMSDRL